MALITGISSRPRSVSAYSTDGGDEATTCRVTTPLLSSARRRALNVFAEMRGISERNSPKRRGAALRNHTTLGVQAPPSSFMHIVSGQIGGGGSTRLLRSFNAMVANLRLPDGYHFFLVSTSYLVAEGNPERLC